MVLVGVSALIYRDRRPQRLACSVHFPTLERDLGPGFAPDDRDDRDQGFREGRGDRGEDAPDGALPKADPAPEPLDRVREQQRPREENGEARRQEDGRAHEATTATAQTRPRAGPGRSAVTS
jgi:hypothetical protein